MVNAISYRIQERTLGGLKPATQRLLDRIVEGRLEASPERIPKRRVSAGTLLIREWRGVSHRVTVLDNDVVYRKRYYKSLSEVARAITGALWWQVSPKPRCSGTVANPGKARCKVIYRAWRAGCGRDAVDAGLRVGDGAQ
jgi:Protein of unknown function (DUF2924)